MTLTPPEVGTPGSETRRSYVRGMFTAIAPRYDLLNHLLSLNVDRAWRRRAVARLGWQAAPQGTYLDLCAGTLDLAAELAGRPGFGGSVVGADFVIPMLRLGGGKAEALRPVGADALALPFADATFDGCTIGFGIRNLVDIDAGVAEMARVLRPGARLVILEFSTPTAWPMRPLYLFYFRHILPRVGRLVSGHATAYTYLPGSVEEFAEPAELKETLERNGFGEVRQEPLTLGIATLHSGSRR
ncbi:MAG: ubiquinone/menaquinone biosynthesis methyltransferase [Gemmatimonadota bacterium]|nr:MAG: ubiquinone/menaquinone biosynthesis methyltransferase [Gemmatimonadota bacterium]